MPRKCVHVFVGLCPIPIPHYTLRLGFFLRAPQSEVLQHSKAELCVKRRSPGRQGGSDGAVPWALAVPWGSERAGWRKIFCLTISATLTCIETLQSHLLGSCQWHTATLWVWVMHRHAGESIPPLTSLSPQEECSAAFIQCAHTMLSLGITF